MVNLYISFLIWIYILCSMKTKNSTRLFIIWIRESSIRIVSTNSPYFDKFWFSLNTIFHIPEPVKKIYVRNPHLNIETSGMSPTSESWAHIWMIKGLFNILKSSRSILERVWLVRIRLSYFIRYEMCLKNNIEFHAQLSRIIGRGKTIFWLNVERFID